MVKVETGVSFLVARGRFLRRIPVAAALIARALSASAGARIDQCNSVGAEKYKMEFTPDVPASKTYDQGLDKLAHGSPSEAAK